MIISRGVFPTMRHWLFFKSRNRACGNTYLIMRTVPFWFVSLTVYIHNSYSCTYRLACVVPVNVPGFEIVMSVEILRSVSQTSGS